jgi:RimJ/RimL family protein N-acetyltransferase
MVKPFVPEDFQIPQELIRQKFKFRMLKITDVVKDYDAVMTSIDHLQGVFGKRSTWPAKTLTFEQDLIDLGWHQKEFQRRSSFAYTIMAPDENECLGCLYIFPSTNDVYDVEVYVWVRKSAYEKGLDPIVLDELQKWIKDKWPFNKVFYPGRK